MPDFGWSLPPGAAGDPMAPWNQEDPPCEVCGEVDDCICLICPECRSIGNPRCYAEHGMARTERQVILLAWNEAIWEDQGRQEAAAVDQMLREQADVDEVLRTHGEYAPQQESQP